MIAVLVTYDADGRLRTRSEREVVTRNQLAVMGIDAARLHTICFGCGATDHGALRLPAPVAAGASRARSHDWYAFAASNTEATLGIDLEPLTRAPQALEAVSAFSGDGDDENAEDGYRALRTLIRKEAILKARGVGLHVDPRSQPTSARLACHGWLLTSAGWWLHERQIGEVLACIAARAPHRVQLTTAPIGPDPGRDASVTMQPTPAPLGCTAPASPGGGDSYTSRTGEGEATERRVAGLLPDQPVLLPPRDGH